MQAVLTEIVSLLTGGITGIATGIGKGLQDLVSSIFLTGTGEGQTLSTFGAITIVFGGVALAIGLSRFVLRFLTSLGN